MSKSGAAPLSIYAALATSGIEPYRGAMTIKVHSVQIGRTAPLGPEGVPSGFVKRPVIHRIEVSALGLAGDEQGDLSVHGGPEKAVYGYAMRHYPVWHSEYPEHAQKLRPGAFGENLTIEGLDEADIMVGDVHRIGSALLQVCQPRQPCFKLALHFNDNRLPRDGAIRPCRMVLSRPPKWRPRHRRRDRACRSAPA